jgi:hypothetical protein
MSVSFREARRAISGIVGTAFDGDKSVKAQSLRRRVRALFLVALTLVPLAAGGHFHAAAQDGTPDSCAACMVKHQAGTTLVIVQPAIVPLPTISTVVVSVAVVPAFIFRPLRIGRAPPTLFASRIV